ncbi:HIT family protein [Olsenella uli]|uniref:HIT family protein n=1 Tax=Olsenella uli TaxID=133926 RepID=UPI0025706929|nr:HIT family protein [Olsenella uli]
MASPLCELPASQLILFREQSHRGRCIVASKRHVDDISDLTEEESAAFMADVRHVAAALHRAFSPDKINFGAYGDTMHHLHFHLVPKYADDPFEFGDVFAMNPGRVTLSDAECDALAEKILAAL